MCGIFWALVQLENQDIYRKAFELLQHRGPNNSFFEVVGQNAIGFHHLSIVSAMPDHPHKEGEWSVVCNGEIYSSDIDCKHMLGACNLEDKSSFLRQINGDFACIWISPNRICAARDPVGVCPMYYALSSENAVIGFASEAKALVGLPFVVSVKRFLPGHWWDSNCPESFIPYTDIYTGIPQPNVSVHNLLEKATQKRLTHADVPVALLCSGGIDSSIVAYLSRQVLPTEKLHAFSVTFDSANGRSEDLVFATSLLKSLDIQHTIVKFTEEDIRRVAPDVVTLCETDDPITIRAAIPMYLLAEHIRTKTEYKVILSGEGADEIFMGYTYFEHAPSGIHASQECKRLIQNIHSFDLLRAERCFASHGLEVRVPFLDTEVVRHVLALDGNSRLPVKGEEKTLLRNAFKNAKELVDTGIIRRTKMRMSDGVSFSYVPSLLRLWSGTNSPGSQGVALDKMEETEKNKYKSFLSFKPDIIPRTMPKWENNKTTPNVGLDLALNTGLFSSFLRDS